MNVDILREAQDALSIGNIYIRSIESTIAEDITPEQIEYLDLERQEFQSPKRYIQYQFEEDSFETQEIRYEYIIGTRLIEAKAKEKNNEETNNVFELKAIFEARYQSKVDVSDASLKEFGIHNVGFHVWPYWRELVQSTCLRMGITPIEVKMYVRPRLSDKKIKDNK